MERPLLTVRVTVLEAFRLFMHGQTEKNQSWNTEANLIDSIKGVYLAGDKADFGSAGHTIIETPRENRQWFPEIGKWGYSINGYNLTTDQVMPVLNYYQEFPQMVREVPLAKLYRPQLFDLIVTGTCDALNGIQVRDNKFKFGQFDMSDYMNSFQHRFYLDMLDMHWFYYDFFKVTGFETKADCYKAVIHPCESLMVHSYPAMRSDIDLLLNEFAEFITFRGLESYLEITTEKHDKIMASEMPIYQPQ